MGTSARDKRFAVADLAFNIGGGTLDLGEAADCNPGGSYICTTGTRGCDAGLTCVGTSSTGEFLCQGASDDVFNLGLNARILVEREQLEALRTELQQVVSKFGKR